MIVRSPHPDVKIPDIALTPFVLHRAEELADKPALVDGWSGRSLSYAQLSRAVRRVAAGLADRGFRKGDVFAIFSPNLPEYAVAFHAVTLLGGIVTTINSLNTADEVAFQLGDSGARFLLTVEPFLDRALPSVKRSGVRELFVVGEAEGVTPFASLTSGGDATAPDVDIDPSEDVAVLPYSSGTTGFPKAVMLTHFNLVANLCQAVPPRPIDETDTLIGVLPFFHIYGMALIMNMGLYRGATIVTLPRFDLIECLKVIQDYGVTRGYFVPPIMLALARDPIVDTYDLSKLKSIMSGGAPLRADVARACRDRLGCAVVEGYGLTETSPATHVVPDTGEQKPGSIGPPIPNTECRVVDVATAADLGPHQDGELWIRGPQVMRGYLNNPEATAATIDGDGWLHTGDIGHADDDGYFFIVDRLKELIKYKGHQVAPAELEAILAGHVAVADAAVIPKPDPEAGEVPKAFVVRNGHVSEEELMAFVAERVSPHKRVRAVEFVDAIPKSASGKILRRVLVERERAGGETA